jgi:hypothetical protein
MIYCSPDHFIVHSEVSMCEAISHPGSTCPINSGVVCEIVAIQVLDRFSYDFQVSDPASWTRADLRKLCFPSRV